MSKAIILEGKKYLKNAKGALIPFENVKKSDKTKDRLVEKLFSKAEKLHNGMKKVKESMAVEIQKYLEDQAANHGVKWKGNAQLDNFGGDKRISVSIKDMICFSEKLQVAKEVIDECVRKWSKNADPALVTLITTAFEVDKKGNINKTMILSLRQYKIEDERWKEAMDLISEAIQVEATKTYYLFKFKGEEGEWEQLSLNWSKL